MVPAVGPHVVEGMQAQMHCQKCGHRWFPRIIEGRDGLPKVCSKCKSRNFHLPLMKGLGRPKRKKPII